GRLRERPRRDVRPRALGRAARAPDPRARSPRRETALLRRDRRRLLLRLRAEGAACHRRRLPHARLDGAGRLSPHGVRARPGELATFALGFDVPGFDERGHAAVAARALGTRHRTLTITPELFLEGVRDLLPVLDEPLADPAFVPTFLLSRFARSEVKVVLVGEGGDELFAGYPTYLGSSVSAAFRRLPPALRRAVVAGAPLLGAPRGHTTLRYLL